MNKSKRWMTVFTVILAAACVAAAWKIGWQKREAQKPGTGETEVSVTEGMEEAKIPVTGIIYRFNEATGSYVMFKEENDEPFYISGIDEGKIYGENGEQITEGELDTGDRVTVMTDGIVLETYPGQYARVFRVEVAKKANMEEREACIQKYEERVAEFYSEPDPSEKPIMQVSYTEDAMVSMVWLTQGGYHWKWTDADGQGKAEIADAPFITEWSEIAEIKLTDSVTEMEILPGKEAEEITVSRWRGNDVQEAQESVNVEKRGDRWYLTGVQKGYYYLFHVRWGESYVEYGFKGV